MRAWCCERETAPSDKKCRTAMSDIQQRLVDVGDDVFEVFDADGKADETVGDADAVAHFLGHGSVGHLRGQGDQGFDTPETFRERADFDLVEEAARGFLGAEIESQHRARAFLLAAS
jgi:hypothetical protein